MIEAQVDDNPAYLYYTIGVAVICVISNILPYFFPFREHLANENDIIGSIIGSHKPHKNPGSQDGDLKSNGKSNRQSKNVNN